MFARVAVIVIRVLGADLPPEAVEDAYKARAIAKARTRCLALSKRYPSRWVEAKCGSTVIHRLEPSAYADVPELEPVMPAPEQTPIF